MRKVGWCLDPKVNAECLSPLSPIGRDKKNLNRRPGAKSIKLYGSINYGFVVTAKF